MRQWFVLPGKSSLYSLPMLSGCCICKAADMNETLSDLLSLLETCSLTGVTSLSPLNVLIPVELSGSKRSHLYLQWGKAYDLRVSVFIRTPLPIYSAYVLHPAVSVLPSFAQSIDKPPPAVYVHACAVTLVTNPSFIKLTELSP